MIMKTRNIILTSLAMILMFGLVGSSYAMGGNGMGNGKGSGQWGGNGGAGQQMQKSDHNPADMLVGVPLQDLSEDEKNDLLYSYSEETLAHDMYMYFYELYGQQTFLNIANSESEHQAAVKALLDRYGLETPTDYGELSDEFEALKAEGEQGLKEALEVGVKIEILDIEDIAETILSTDNDDMKIIFTNIGGASYNHLRGFVKALNNNGFETELDYEMYVTDEEIASMEMIKDKMAEKVISEGGTLPEQASPEAIAERCANKQSGQGQGNSAGKGMGNGQGNENGAYYNANINKYVTSNVVAAKNRYKNAVESKYTAPIANLSDETLEILLERIDVMIEEINADEVNERTTALLLLLREITATELSNR